MTTPVYRAPMRARDRDVPGADFGLSSGVVGIGDPLPAAPASLAEAVLAATEIHSTKAGRMLAAFAAVSDGAFVWTRAADGGFHLGRIAGPWRYLENDAGIVHVRPATWLPRSLAPPPAVRATFARGGRNFQRIRDAEAERLTAALWPAEDR